MTAEHIDGIRDRFRAITAAAPDRTIRGPWSDIGDLLAEVDQLTEHAAALAAERDEALRALRTVVRNPDVAADDHTTLPRLRALAGLDADGHPLEDQ